MLLLPLVVNKNEYNALSNGKKCILAVLICPSYGCKIAFCSLYGRHIAANALPPPKTTDKSKKISRKAVGH